MKRKKEEKALKKNSTKLVVVTKVAKNKPLAKTAAALKETLHVFVKGDTSKITTGRRGTTPLLHPEGLFCAVEVPSTRGSHEGELFLRK